MRSRVLSLGAVGALALASVQAAPPTGEEALDITQVLSMAGGTMSAVTAGETATSPSLRKSPRT